MTEWPSKSTRIAVMTDAHRRIANLAFDGSMLTDLSEATIERFMEIGRIAEMAIIFEDEKNVTKK